MKFVNRNNVQQIQRNKELIELHYETDRVIAAYGITIIGQLQTWPDPAPAVPSSFGDTYLVGAEPPYDFYIWTRLSATTPLEEGAWVNIGSISIPGPEGPRGVGIQRIERVGDQMNIHYTDGQTFLFGNVRGAEGKPGKDGGSPTIKQTAILGGTRVEITNADGSISAFTIHNGKDGASIKGDKGDPGAFNIKGVLPIDGTLPDPEDMTPGDAYLRYTTDAKYDLWLVAGTEPDNYEWVNTGAVGAGTQILQSGVALGQWNADTKLDKVSTAEGKVRAYSVTANGGQVMYPITWDKLPTPSGQTIAGRDPDGTISVAWPSNNDDATSKEYVDYAVSQGGGGTFAMESIESDGDNVYLDRNMDLFNARIAFIDLQCDDMDGYRYHFNATFCPCATSDVPSGQQVIPSTNPNLNFWIDAFYNQNITSQKYGEEFDNYSNWRMIVRYIP